MVFIQGTVTNSHGKVDLGPYLGEGLTELAGLLSRTESLRFCFRITRVSGKWRQRKMV